MSLVIVVIVLEHPGRRRARVTAPRFDAFTGSNPCNEPDDGPPYGWWGFRWQLSQLVESPIIGTLVPMGAQHGQQFGPVIEGLGIGVGVAVAGWMAIGPNHLVFAVVVQGAFLFMALLVGPTLVDVRRSRYRVRAVEPRIYTLLGAEMLRRVLDAVGWNRLIGHMRQ